MEKRIKHWRLEWKCGRMQGIEYVWSKDSGDAIHQTRKKHPGCTVYSIKIVNE